MLYPPNETDRIHVLREYQILDTLPDEAIDRITRLASLLCETPISLVTLLDENRQWFKANVGMPASETPRQVALCNYVVADGAPLEVPNTTLDERFQQNPLVTADPAIRFYAGYPLTDPNGYVLGSLCVIDQQPRQLSPLQHKTLELLSQTVVELIVERRNQQKQRQFDQLFVRAGDLIAMASRAGSFKTVNPAFERVLGWGADELLGTELFSWVHPDDRASTRQLVEAVTNEPVELTNRFRCQNGTYRHLHWVMSLEPDTDNLFAIIRDVTTQKQQEEALQQAQRQLEQTNQELEQRVTERTQELSQLHQRFQLAVQAARMGVWSFDLARNELVWNDVLYQLCGLVNTGQPLQAGDFERLLHPEDVAAYTPRHQQPQINQARTNQLRIIRPDGQVRWLELYGIRLDNAAGEAIGSVGVVQDITERKAAESALQLALQRHRLATKAGKLGVWELDLRTGGIQLEADFYTLLGLPRTANITHLRDLEGLLPPRDQAQLKPRLQALLTQGSSIDTEFRVVSPLDGAVYYLRVDGQVLSDAQGKPERVIGVMRDRTSARETQRALQASEARYRSLVDELQVVVFQTDARGHWSFLNPAWEAVTGYAVEATLGQLFLESVLPASRANSQQRFEELITGQSQSVRHLTRYRHQGGGYRWIEVFAQRTLDARQQLTGVTGTLTDVTARKEADGRASQLHERLQLATQAAGQGIWVVDMATDGLNGDERMWALHGIPVPDRPLSMMEFVETIDVRDRSAFIQKAHTRLLGTSEQIADSYRIQRADGVEQWVETSGRILRDSQGRAQRLIGVAWDVTQRKQAEAALRASEERFQEIASHVGEIFWVWDVQSQRFLYANPAYETMSGLSRADLYANPGEFMRFVVEEDHPLMVANFQHPRPDTQLQFRVHHRRGQVRWLQARIVEVYDESGGLLRRIGVATDITAAMEKEQILEESLHKQRRLTEHQAQFITTASHMFRTPLTAMSTSLELARLYLDRIPVSPASLPIHKHLEAIGTKINALDGLIGDTLSLDSGEPGQSSVSWSTIDLEGLIALLIESQFDSYARQGRSVAVWVEGQPMPVAGDKRLLESVLGHLLQNAFTYSVGVPRLVLRYEANSVVVQIIDEGIGIPLEDQPYIFDRFFRARNTSDFQGLGLGLAICQEYVRLLGGTLEVASTEGVGTTVTFRLSYAVS